MTSDAPIGARELMSRIGNAFEREGWRDEENLALAISRAAGAAGTLDTAAAAALASPAFLARGGIDPAKLEAVLAPIFAGRVPIDPHLDPPPEVTEIHNNNTLQVNGDGNQFSGFVNVGGTQLNLNAESPKDDVLTAVGALVSEALASGLSERNLGALAQLVEGRDDLPEAELRASATEAITAAAPPPGRLAALRDSLTTSVISGVLVHALIVAIEVNPFF